MKQARYTDSEKIVSRCGLFSKACGLLSGLLYEAVLVVAFGLTTSLGATQMDGKICNI